MATITTRVRYMSASGLGTDLMTTALHFGAHIIFAGGE